MNKRMVGMSANLKRNVFSTHLYGKSKLQFFYIHSNLDLMRVLGMSYTKSRLTLDLSKCKQSGPYELLSSCRLAAASKRITRFRWLEASAKDVPSCSHVKNIYEYIFNFFSKMIIFITTKAFLKPQSIQLCKVYNVPGVHLTSQWNNFKNDL